VTWVNAVVQGVLLGGFYALLACGLSLMFGVMRIINLAHGDIAVVGAYLVWLLSTQLSISPFIAALLVLPAMWVVGYAMYVLLLERSRRAGLLVPLLTTFGLAIVIENVLLQVFSPDVHSLLSNTGSLATASVQLGSGLSFSALGTLIFAIAVVVLTGLQLFLSRTNAGRQMRATAEDPDAAELVGINARAVYARATAIAVAIAALGGIFLAIRSTFDPSTGPTQLIFAFEAVVIGGFGSAWGTLLGGIVLGVAQVIGEQVNPQYAVLFGHIVFLAVLASPRGGLLSRRGRAL
jgi:branched-chain amino acid transport system permease protein